MIEAIDIYARFHAEGDEEGEHSLRLAVTGRDIEIKTGAGVITLAHEDFDQIARLVARCRAAWSRLAQETETDADADPDPDPGQTTRETDPASPPREPPL